MTAVPASIPNGDAKSAEANAPVETPEQKLERKKKSKADRKMFSDHNFSERPWESETERAQFQQLLEQQGGAVSDYWRKKYETDAKRNWDIFYKSHEAEFFKDRHYIQREFGELDKAAKDKKRYRLFEIGCGCGNTLFPLMEDCPHLDFYACDFSPRGVGIIQKRLKEMNAPEDRCTAWVADLTADSFDAHIQEAPQFATLIFVLSAIAPEKMPAVMQKVFSVMAPGGVVFIRDYALFDMTQLRFKKGSKIADNFYVRGDGTRSYFFTTEAIGKLVTDAGFEVFHNAYVRKDVQNKKMALKMRRSWVQLKIRKPLTAKSGSEKQAGTAVQSTDKKDDGSKS